MADCSVMGSFSDKPQDLRYDGAPAAYGDGVPDVSVNGKQHVPVVSVNGQPSLHYNINSGFPNMMPSTGLSNKRTERPRTLSPIEHNQVNNMLGPVQDPSITSQSPPGFWLNYKHGSPPPYCGPGQSEPNVQTTQLMPPLALNGHQTLPPQQWPAYTQNEPFLAPPPHISPPHMSPPPPAHILQPSPYPTGIPISLISLPQTAPQALPPPFHQPAPMHQQQPHIPYPQPQYYNPPQFRPAPDNIQLNVQGQHMTPFGNVTSYEINGTIYYSYNGQFPAMPGHVPFIPMPGPVYFSPEDNEVAVKESMKLNEDVDGQVCDDRRPSADEPVLPPSDEHKPEMENSDKTNN